MDEQVLRSRVPVPELRYFTTIDSTNNYALGWARQGAPDGALVVADHQTAGRGRFKRQWVTHPGTALAFTIIFCPTPGEKQYLALFSALGAVALSDTLSVHYGLANEIKWPNDVLLNHRKVAGILAESEWQGSEVMALVLGIGINIAPESVPPPGEVLFPATCVEEALGKRVERVDFLAQLIKAISAWRPGLGSPEFHQAWESRLAFRQETIQVEQDGQTPLTGTLIGVDQEGNLRLQVQGNQIINVAAGDVRLRPVEATSP